MANRTWKLKKLPNLQTTKVKISSHPEFQIGATDGANREIFTTVILFYFLAHVATI